MFFLVRVLSLVAWEKIYTNTNSLAKELFEQANEILGFRISDIMFEGTDEALKQTNVTQPAVFLHSVIAYKTIGDAKPNMVAGHSLGEFSALVANNTLSFEDALKLVSIRANAMQKACEINPSTMAAVLALADDKVEEICAAVQAETGEVVVAANYNCPGQLVISGSMKGIEIACEQMKAAGAKRALVLPVGGAFHSPLMAPAKAELAAAIEATTFNTPSCPVYQNVVASGSK
ncbi:MAG: ACP S-malonyltransferase [Chitinophagaceae bacterium]